MTRTAQAAFWCLTLALLAILVVASSRGPIFALIAVAVAASLALLASQGAERTAVLFLMLAFATAPMYRGLKDLSGAPVPPTDPCIIIAVLLLLPTLIGRPLRIPTKFLIGVSGTTVFGLFATVSSPDALLGLFPLIQFLLFLGFLPVFVAWWRPDHATIVALMWAYVAGHLVSVAYALANGPVYAGRYQGLTNHPNIFGFAGTVMIAVLLYLFAHHRDVRTQALIIGLGVVSVASIAMSGSRGAIVVGAVLVLMIAVVERSFLWGVVLAGAGSLVLVGFPFLVSLAGKGSALERLAGDPTAQVSDAARSNVLEAGFQRFLDSPLRGSGMTAIAPYHNILLEVAIATGVFGLASYLLALYVLAKPLFFDHPERRLCYLTFAFLGTSPVLLNPWDRTVWVPMMLVILPAIGAMRSGERIPEPASADLRHDPEQGAPVRPLGTGPA